MLENYSNNELILFGKLVMAIDLLRDDHTSRDAVAMELDIDPEILTPLMNCLGQYKSTDLAEQLLKNNRHVFSLY